MSHHGPSIDTVKVLDARVDGGSVSIVPAAAADDLGVGKVGAFGERGGLGLCLWRALDCEVGVPVGVALEHLTADFFHRAADDGLFATGGHLDFPPGGDDGAALERIREGFCGGLGGDVRRD